MSLISLIVTHRNGEHRVLRDGSASASYASEETAKAAAAWLAGLMRRTGDTVEVLEEDEDGALVPLALKD